MCSTSKPSSIEMLLSIHSNFEMFFVLENLHCKLLEGISTHGLASSCQQANAVP